MFGKFSKYLMFVGVGFFAGLAFYKFQIFPVPAIAGQYRYLSSLLIDEPPAIAANANSVMKLIGLNSYDQGLLMRDELKRHILAKSKYSIEATEGMSGSPLAYGTGVRQSKFSVTMKYGVKSTAFVMRPKNYSRTMVIFHAGHGAAPEDFGGRNLVEKLLKLGFGVALFSMPLEGFNKQDLYADTAKFGKIPLKNHEAFELLQADGFSPISYFIAPISSFLDYSDRNLIADRYVMVGHSGGGWTTAVVAAIEPRIERSYIISGVAPEYLRSSISFDQWGDFEQNHYAVLAIANYTEMLTLASLEKHRKTTQIFVRNDSCCFRMTGKQSYAKAINSKLDQWGGGAFRIEIDNKSFHHGITDFSVDIIVKDLTQRAFQK